MISEEMTNGGDLAVTLTAGDRKIFELVDTTVEQAISQNNIQPVMAMGRALKRNLQASGLALSKLLYRAREVWELLGYDEDMFESIYAEMGISHSTAHKYINMWEAVFANPDIPDDVKEDIEGKPIKALLLLTAAAREGQISNEDWDKIAEASTSSEVRNIVRDIRGERTSSRTAMVLELNMKSGVLVARRGGERDTTIGVFNVGQRTQNDLVEAAITKIISNCGIMER